MTQAILDQGFPEIIEKTISPILSPNILVENLENNQQDQDFVFYNDEQCPKKSEKKLKKLSSKKKKKKSPKKTRINQTTNKKFSYIYCQYSTKE